MIEHPEFQKLLQLAQSAPSELAFPSRRTLQRQIQMKAQDQQKDILQKLPPKAKLSISLDCWTSPFQQAFIAVTAYFIDIDWQYREVLLGFEPLYGSHTGLNLSTVVLDLLQKYQIEDRVLAVTTDNASNNGTLISSLQDSIQSLDLHPDTMIIRVPCIAHVIQLSLKQLLGQMKANPSNETIEMVWSEERTKSARHAAQQYNMANTLNKV